MCTNPNLNEIQEFRVDPTREEKCCVNCVAAGQPSGGSVPLLDVGVDTADAPAHPLPHLRLFDPPADPQTIPNYSLTCAI